MDILSTGLMTLEPEDEVEAEARFVMELICREAAALKCWNIIGFFLPLRKNKIRAHNLFHHRLTYLLFSSPKAT